jgi:CpeT protein
MTTFRAGGQAGVLLTACIFSVLLVGSEQARSEALGEPAAGSGTEEMEAGTPAADDEGDALAVLAGWMTGSFNSAEQAAADSSYYDIRLEMVPVWMERSDGIWLYVEQAVAGATDRPYRQRVYRVVALEENLFKSEVYTIPDAPAYARAWEEGPALPGVTPEDLGLRKGCAVLLRRSANGDYAGATIGRCCSSELRGAAYATSEVIISDGRIESWDRGFDVSGEQVWGAEAGPYVFLRSAE